MKKIALLLILCVNSYAFFGFGGNIDKAKNTIFEKLDPSVTIGDVIDSYQMCEGTKWEEIKTSNGRIVVEANCKLKNEFVTQGNEYFQKIVEEAENLTDNAIQDEQETNQKINSIIQKAEQDLNNIEKSYQQKLDNADKAKTNQTEWMNSATGIAAEVKLFDDMCKSDYKYWLKHKGKAYADDFMKKCQAKVDKKRKQMEFENEEIQKEHSEKLTNAKENLQYRKDEIIENRDKQIEREKAKYQERREIFAQNKERRIKEANLKYDKFKQITKETQYFDLVFEFALNKTNDNFEIAGIGYKRGISGKEPQIYGINIYDATTLFLFFSSLYGNEKINLFLLRDYL